MACKQKGAFTMKYNLHDVMSKAWEIYHANKQ